MGGSQNGREISEDGCDLKPSSELSCTAVGGGHLLLHFFFKRGVWAMGGPCVAGKALRMAAIPSILRAFPHHSWA